MAKNKAQQAAIAISMKKAGKKPKSLPKAQKGKIVKPTADSSAYYTNRMLSYMDMADRSKGELKERFTKRYNQAASDLNRQSKKGKPGYDANGFPIKKKMGGSVKPKKK